MKKNLNPIYLNEGLKSKLGKKAAADVNSVTGDMLRRISGKRVGIGKTVAKLKREIQKTQDKQKIAQLERRIKSLKELGKESKDNYHAWFGDDGSRMAKYPYIRLPYDHPMIVKLQKNADKGKKVYSRGWKKGRK